MSTSIFLAKVIGWYLVIVSLFLLCRQKQLQALIKEITTKPALLFVIALMTLILGILMVVSHNIWVMAWPVIITILSWIVLISAIIRLMIFDKATAIGEWWMKHSFWLYVAGILYLILGLTLLYLGYC